jgi:hypothetical protein
MEVESVSPASSLPTVKCYKPTIPMQGGSGETKMTPRAEE